MLCPVDLPVPIECHQQQVSGHHLGEHATQREETDGVDQAAGRADHVQSCPDVGESFLQAAVERLAGRAHSGSAAIAE